MGIPGSKAIAWGVLSEAEISGPEPWIIKQYCSDFLKYNLSKNRYICIMTQL